VVVVALLILSILQVALEVEVQVVVIMVLLVSQELLIWVVAAVVALIQARPVATVDQV
jgi:hypothetical protein